MGFPRQEYWNGVPFPTPGDLPDPGMEPAFLVSPALANRALITSASWETQYKWKASFDSDLVVIVKYSTGMILTYYCHDQIVPFFVMLVVM